MDFSLVISICTINPAISRRMDRPPNLQSKNRSMTNIVTAVTADPVISGSWCAKKFSVCAVFSLMIFRSLPLLFWEKKEEPAKEPAMEWAADNGVLTAVQLAEPEKAVTRRELAEVLYRCRKQT